MASTSFIPVGYSKIEPELTRVGHFSCSTTQFFAPDDGYRASIKWLYYLAEEALPQFHLQKLHTYKKTRFFRAGLCYEKGR